MSPVVFVFDVFVYRTRVSCGQENEQGGKELLEVVEAAAATRKPEQAPETDGNFPLAVTDGNTSLAETDTVAQVLESANHSAPNTNGVITANQREEGARAAEENGQEVRENVTEFVFGNLFS